MALIHCSSCNRVINDQKLTCPYCGAQTFAKEIEEPFQEESPFQAQAPFQIRRLAFLSGFGLLAFFFAFLVYGLVLIAAAFAGLKVLVGGVFAFFILIGICYFGVSKLAIPLFAFWGAYSAWEWPWYFAFPFAAPGLALALLFLIPSLYAEMKYLILNKVFKR